MNTRGTTMNASTDGAPDMASSSKETVRRQREIQQQVDEKDKAAKAKKASK